MEYFGNFAATRKIMDEEAVQIDRMALKCLARDITFTVYFNLETGLTVEQFFSDRVKEATHENRSDSEDFFESFRTGIMKSAHPYDTEKLLEFVSVESFKKLLKYKKSESIYTRWRFNSIYRYNKITITKEEAIDQEPVHVFLISEAVDATTQSKIEDDERKSKYASGIYALSREYGSVYYVNLETGELSPYNLSNRIEGMFGDEFYKVAYDDAVDSYIESAVIEEDKPMMKEILSRDYIRKNLTSQDMFIREYLNNENKYCEMKCVRVTRPDNADACVMGFAVKDDEIREKMEREKQKDFQLSLLDGLSREYHTVFLIHPDKHMELFRTTGNTTIIAAIKYGANSSDCDRSFRLYAERYISDKDRDRLIKEITFDNLQKMIPAMGIYKVSYERVNENLDTTYHQMCFARAVGLNGEEKIVLGFRDVDAIVRRENDEKQRVATIINERDMDGLTRLRNRFCFENRIKELPSCDYGTISCIYFDADGLHELNNTKGHEAGDNMLRTLALNIVKYWDGENSFRIGGDEFIVFLYDYDSRQLVEEVDALRENIRKAGYSVSVGYTVTTVKDLNIENVIRTAENLMYYEKKKYYTGDKDRRHQ